MCKLPDWYRQVEDCRHVPLLKHFVPQKEWGWFEVDRIPVVPGETNLYIYLQCQILQAVHCIGWNNCS